ncbi:hypothetical protein BCR33DRAFT_722015 [Rhizoclosmatium globosum]|uniref:Uncharacterized protein n=1 Tax=Rhizoclosmatium globosum TaxID=329046 RepID=A0A1Y2BP21_9FUNG|nr:hypothetical protein BCR33DRAFT_722015 [Rhizoclosmatium globosum]|eukprot:ORY36500.1 hypothetical protein BCR33DRAFT_722015 [Rhizoclosmatium globosum]
MINISELERKAQQFDQEYPLNRHERSSSSISVLSPRLATLPLQNYPRHPIIPVHDNTEEITPNPRHERRATIQVHSESEISKERVVIVPPVPGMSEEERRGGRITLVGEEQHQRETRTEDGFGLKMLQPRFIVTISCASSLSKADKLAPPPPTNKTLQRSHIPTSSTSNSQHILHQPPQEIHQKQTTTTKRALRPSIALQKAHSLNEAIPKSPSTAPVISQIPPPPKAMTVIPSAAEPPGGPWSVNDMNAPMNAPVKTNAPRKWKLLDMAEGKKTGKTSPRSTTNKLFGKLGASVYNKLDYADPIANILGISEGRYEEYYEDCEAYEHDMARVSIGAQERIATGELREALRKPENA